MHKIKQRFFDNVDHLVRRGALARHDRVREAFFAVEDIFVVEGFGQTVGATAPQLRTGHPAAGGLAWPVGGCGDSWADSNRRRDLALDAVGPLECGRQRPIGADDLRALAQSPGVVAPH